jgi:hypothetical protein
MSLTKNELCWKCSLEYPFENIHDPIHNLLSSSNEIEEIFQKHNYKKKFLFLYFNKNKFHNILYDEDEIYFVDENIKINYSELFYLSLLLVDISETINYRFSLDFIILVNNIIKENEEIKEIKRILISKIILVLIENFKGEEEYNEKENGEQIKKIEAENEKYIKDYVFIFKQKLNLDYDYNDVISKKIDYIYMEIIISLPK